MCLTRLSVLAALSRKLRSALWVVDSVGKEFPPRQLPTTPGNTSQNRAWGNPQESQLQKVFLSLAEACIPGPLPEQESGALVECQPHPRYN